MIFNSVVFLLCFLPLCLLVYYLSPGRAKNAVLLVASLLFFCWSGVRFLPLILVLVGVNYLAGLFLDRSGSHAEPPPVIRQRLILAGAISITLGALIVFKYAAWLLGLLGNLGGLSLTGLSFLEVLPLGISYYTFKLISYVADVYTGKIKAERSPLTFAAYVVMFPQLLVGPIVKYSEISEQLHNTRNRCSLAQAQAGAEMFVFGLAKKVILADSIGALWQAITGVWTGNVQTTAGVGLANVSTPLAWLGILAYSLQLYFDFAGYSEMSNGLSKMMGFDCPANFNLPYISASITEFWRRWHISLSVWFRDYVYIPLGGNRKGLPRQIVNMLVVWALTGIWHGANWNFICWGLYYFILLTIEKAFLLKYLKKSKVLSHIYTLFFVVVGWGIFTANSAGAPLGLLMGKLFLPQGGVSPLYFLRSYGVILLVGILCSTPLPGKLWAWAKAHTPIRLALLGGVLTLSFAYVVAATSYAPLYAGF